jgi:hypothetical protein
MLFIPTVNKFGHAAQLQILGLWVQQFILPGTDIKKCFFFSKQAHKAQGTAFYCMQEG